MTRTPRSSAWSFIRRPRIEEEVDTEFAFHVDMTIRLLIADGMPAADARAEAVRRFGDMAVVEAECRRFGRQRDRGRSRVEYVEELKQDLGFAFRQFGRARAFSATAIVTLALGIGATAAVFSALYAVVLQPLPFADASRVVQIWPTRRGNIEFIASGAELAAFRARRDAFTGVAAAVTGGEFTLTGEDVPEQVGGARVTADYFSVLGVVPMLGRGFLASDDVPGAPRVALFSHRLWRRRFASDTTLVGRTIRLSEEQYLIIGVMPASFDATGTHEDIWAPLQLTTAQLTGSGGRWLRVIARLAPGKTLAQATSAAHAAAQVAVVRTAVETRNVGAVVRRYLDATLGNARQRLFVLFGAAGFVLLIACVNVANLLLARGTSRARELAIRAALGAGRGRLVRQLLAESLMLSLGGAVLGVGVAYALVKGFVAFAPEGVPRIDQAQVNTIVLTFTLGVAVVCSVLTGLVPAIRSARPALQSALRDGGRGAGTGVRRGQLRALLVAAEVALAMTLLTGSGLLIRTAWRLQHVNPGFSASHVMTARLQLPPARYLDAAQVVRTFEQIRSVAQQVPGVRRAALMSVVPLSGSVMNTRIAREGGALTDDERVDVDIRFASPDYFATMGMPLLEGRDVARTDDASTPPVAVISASLAQKWWPGKSAVGRRLDAMRLKRDEPNWMTVIGVVPDVRDAALNLPAVPTLYMPFTQMQPGMWKPLGQSLVLVALTTPPPETVLPLLRRAITTVDALLPLSDQHTMEQWLRASLATARFNTLLLVTLGTIALMLASVGVYGVVAYFVSQRTREIGVRMALGAAPQQIWRLVLSRGLTPILWGSLVGTALSVVTARLLREQLYEVSATDPATLAVVAVSLFVVALVATIVPARRATRVMPVVALASE